MINQESRIKDLLDKIVSEVWKQDNKRRETIKNTNKLAKESGFRIDWGKYKVYQEGGSK